MNLKVLIKPNNIFYDFINCICEQRFPKILSQTAFDEEKREDDEVKDGEEDFIEEEGI